MLFEQRTYTLRPGMLEPFWKAQHERGFELMRPILERMFFYASTISGAEQQVVHCYRYDSYEDWTTRLHGLAKVPQLANYFKAVRPMLQAQETKFMALAPVAALNPVWGSGRDWLPADGMYKGLPPLSPDLIIEETTIKLNPGTLPAWWAAWEADGLAAGADALAGLIGTFSTLVGRQHEVVMYRWYKDFAARQSHRAALAGNPQWRALTDGVSASVQAWETKLLLPAQIPLLSPMFTGAPIRD